MTGSVGSVRSGGWWRPAEGCDHDECEFTELDVEAWRAENEDPVARILAHYDPECDTDRELVMAPDGGLREVVQVAAMAGPSNEDRVLRAIHAGGREPADISISLGLSSRSVSTAIKKLRQQGVLATGHPYELTPEGLEAVQ